MTDEPIVVLSDGELPEFEGRIPVGVLTNLQGAAQRIARALHHEDKVVLLVEAKVSSVDHPMTKDGLKRKHVLKVEDMYELAEPLGQRLMSRCKTGWRLADDARHGRTPLEGIVEGADGVALTTDGSGVVMTDGDLADLFVDNGTDPVVVVFSGGTRRQWPDDFGAGVERPAAGDLLIPPDTDGDQPDVVVELLDHATGETVATWTEADQEAREAAEDGEGDTDVYDELLARREARAAQEVADDEAMVAAAIDDLPPLDDEEVEG